MRWNLENLETRQLLSAGVPAIATLLDASAVIAQPMVKTPNIVGTYNGKSVQSNGKSHSLEVIVSTESTKGAITGKAGQPGQLGKFTGKIKGDSFTLTVANGDGTTTLVTGTVSKNGKTLSGTFASDRNGTFTVSR